MGRHHVLQGKPLFVPSPFLIRDAPKTSVPKGQLAVNFIKGSFFHSYLVSRPGSRASQEQQWVIKETFQRPVSVLGPSLCMQVS